MKLTTITVALLALALAGCGGSRSAALPQPARAPKPAIPLTGAAYVLDTIVVRDGGRVAVFPSSAAVTRDRSGTTVVDPKSGRTLRFSARATIATASGSGHLYLRTGEPLAAWARAAHARPAPAPGQERG